MPARVRGTLHFGSDGREVRTRVRSAHRLGRDRDGIRSAGGRSQIVSDWRVGARFGRLGQSDMAERSVTAEPAQTIVKVGSDYYVLASRRASQVLANGR